MKKKLMSGILALIFALQIFVFGTAYASEINPSSDDFVTIGKLSKENYPEIDPATLLRVAKENREELNGQAMEKGASLFSAKSPYINGQQPADPDKPKYLANVLGELTTRGIDGTTFDWDKVLGKGHKVKLLFTQTNGNVMTGVRFYLEVDSAGKYYWKDSDGNPTYLPLYDVDGNPYTYNVQIERNFSEDVQLIIQESNGTPKAAWRPEGDKQVATIQFLSIEIQQVASTKFVSEWHTGLEEAQRPQIEGYFKVEEDVDNDFNFPKNDTERTILRSSFVENFEEDEDNGPWSFLSSELETTPETVEVKTDTPDLTFEEEGGVKTVKSGDHKFKYDFNYDVINGGKLTMTEIIPITFDANGGKFASITDPNADQKFVKEVYYNNDLQIDQVEKPTNSRKTFKGWGVKDDQGNITLVTSDVFRNITTAKTYYAIWDTNEIQAEELTVHESFKNGDTWVNDFIPNLDTLKGQVKIKDENGKPQSLEDTDTFEILDDGGTPIDPDALKNALYGKLKEDDDTEVSRKVILKAKVTRDDGTIQEVEIPLKVIKNIYEAKTLGGKPNYVPDEYVKVTLDPTTKATEPQRTEYYVNPDAKVVIPGENPTGTGDNVFTKWTMKADTATGDGADYNLPDRHQFTEASTITAQYGYGIIKIKYVDENGEVIPEDKRTGGGAYLEEKQGKIGSIVNRDEFISIAPEFEGYVLDRFYYNPKGSTYTENGRNTVTYKYYKKVTTEDKSNDSSHYFKVVFDANGGEFETKPKDKKDVYIYSNPKGIEKDVQVSFEEVRTELEKVYKTPTKANAEFIEWRNKATGGLKVADDYKIQFPGWDGSDGDGYPIEIFYASWNEKIDYSIEKIWEAPKGLTLNDDDYPTMNFTLYRKVKGTEDEPEKVDGADVKEITKTTKTATWKDLPKTDGDGNEYIYSVKETFKDKNSDVKNANWILGTMESDENGKYTITNKLKTVPGEGQTPDSNENLVGKLTIKKVLENEPVDAHTQMRMARAPKASDPLKFKFKVTGPYGYESEEFELGANETKVLKNLAYGKYKVVETDSKGYTSSYSKQIETLTEDSPEGYIEVTNKNIKSDDENENIKNVTVTKVWKGGGEKPATTIELWRTGYGINGKVFKEYVDEFETAANGYDEQSKEFKDLAKHDPSGKEFDYYVKEVSVPTGYTATYSDDSLTVTNTKIAKDGKLTITKKLENIPTRMMMRAPSNNEPIKFGFTITKPDGTSEEFELKAGESKTFDSLTYGKYTVKEIEKHGYIPHFAIGNGEEKQTEEFDLTINSKDEVNLTVTNKNVIDQNDLTLRATKIWVGGPEADHTPVTLQLLRTSAKEGSNEEDVTKEYTVEVTKEGTSDTITYVWRDLPNHDGEGYKYTYRVKELGVDEDGFYTVEASQNKYKSKIEPEEDNTVGETTSFKITNTYQAPEVGEDIIAKKLWKNVPAGTVTPSVKFQLYRKLEGSTIEDKVGEAQELVNNQVNFGKQDRTNANGVVYTYSVKEVNIPEGYTATYSEDGLTVTNTYNTPGSEEKLVEVAAYKKWENNPEGTEKPVVKFQLMRITHGLTSGEAVRTLEVTGEPDGDGLIKVDFGEQKEFNDKGYRYSYYVIELDAKGDVIKDGAVYKDTANNNIKTTYNLKSMTVTNAYVSEDEPITPGEEPPVPTPDPIPNPNPNPNPDPNPNPNPNPNPDPNPNPGTNPDVTPTPGPDDKPIVPGDEDKDKEPDNDKDKDPDKEKTPDKDKNPENKPEDKTPDKDKEKPPVKIDTNKKPDQTGEKVVKTINQTGTKIVSNVKNFLNPTTGIITNYEIYIGLMAASSVGLFFTREKKNKDEE